jgi:hypothetical protein
MCYEIHGHSYGVFHLFTAFAFLLACAAWLTPTLAAAEATTQERRQSVWAVCQWSDVLLSQWPECMEYCTELMATIPAKQPGKKRKGKGVKDFPWMQQMMATYDYYLSQGNAPVPSCMHLN